MSFPGNGRLKLFLGIFCGIVILHVLIIALVAGSAQPDSDDGAVQAQSAAKQTEKANSSVPEKSLWQRLFGSSKKKQKTAAPEKKTEPPAPSYRYRKLSADKNFGKPFSFIYARRGKLPANMVPGDISRAAILVDMNTRRVLWEKNSRTPVAVASMSKMMTMLLAMEHLEQTPQLSLNTPVPISSEVLKKLPSREGIVWLDPRETFPLSDLLKCTAIKSANDAALQIALLVSGSEEKFVAMMNRRSKELGMTDTKFINSHGLPTKKRDQSLSSAHDMVRLGERMLEYPVIMDYFRTISTSIREGNKKTIIKNTNRLIWKSYCSAEGMKTGYTRKAGFCLTFSVKRDGRRLMGCVTGFPTARQRDRFCKNLIDWAFDGCPESYPASKTVVHSGKKNRRAKRSR